MSVNGQNANTTDGGIDNKLYFKFDICTIENLGEKLYNSLPPILTELVANAWDADAKEVIINISGDTNVNKKIIITDDGFGMSRDDVKNNYLTIGKKKREVASDDKTPGQRLIMGRKGIGKLAVFAIADEVTVETCRKTVRGELEKTAFKIDYKNLLKKLDNDKISEDISNSECRPVDEVECTLGSIGTRITLDKLKKSRIMTTAIRQSIARSLPTIFTNDDFKVIVNESEITLDDRDVFKILQAVWFFGDITKLEKIRYSIISMNSTREEKDKIAISNINSTINISEKEETGRLIKTPISLPEGVYGWFGTAKSPNSLKNKDTETTLNEISIIARGKMAEQNVLSEIGKMDRMVISYLTGEIYADFLDESGEKDIATSSRQSLNRDDSRINELFEWGKAAMGEVKIEWEKLREEKDKKELEKIEPALEKYLEILTTKEKKEVEKFYKLASKIHYDDRPTLYRSMTLAYEKIRRTGNVLSIEEKLSDENVGLFVELVKEVGEIEQASYYEIIRKRLAVMNDAKKYLEENLHEKVCQELIYKNLWVLNPLWEKFQTSSEDVKRMEKIVKRNIEEENEKLGRIDIFIAEHFSNITIIELKRPERKVSYQDLMAQVTGYASAIIEEHELTHKIKPIINLMVVVGKMPTGDRKYFDQTGIALYTYQEIIKNIENMYGVYLEEQKKSGEFFQIIEKLEKGVEEALSINVNDKQKEEAVLTS
jgi:hypothetical protein